jgi:hypothetical protein
MFWIANPVDRRKSPLGDLGGKSLSFFQKKMKKKRFSEKKTDNRDADLIFFFIFFEKTGLDF